jgi:hypothetical protein
MHDDLIGTARRQQVRRSHGLTNPESAFRESTLRAAGEVGTPHGLPKLILFDACRLQPAFANVCVGVYPVIASAAAIKA